MLLQKKGWVRQDDDASRKKRLTKEHVHATKMTWGGLINPAISTFWAL